MKELVTYVTLAQEQVGWICQLIRAFDPEDARNLVRTFLRNVNQVRLWIYSTQVNVSGLLVDGDRAQDKPLIDFDTLHERNFRNTPGFMFPSQVATLMQCETEDLLQVAGASFLPIFGAVIANRYPSAPLYVIARRSRQCIVTFVRSEATPVTISNVLANRAELRPPMAFTVLKAEKDDFTNYNRLVRSRTRKKTPLIPEYHPVH